MLLYHNDLQHGHKPVNEPQQRHRICCISSGHRSQGYGEMTRMQIRTTYILLVIVVAGALFSLDRLLLREHANRQQTTAQDIARDHAELLRDYFRSRTQAMTALRVVLAASATTQEAFRRTSAALFATTDGVEAMALLNESLIPTAVWQPVEGDLEPLKALSDRARLRGLVSRMGKTQSTILSGAIALPGKGFAILALTPLTGAQAPGPAYAAGLFRLHAVPPAILRSHSRNTYTVSIEDPWSLVVSDVEGRLPATVTRTETIYIGDDAWRIRVHTPPGQSAVLVFERLTLVAMGVILLAALLVIYHLQAHQHAALAQSHARIAEQAEAAERYNACLVRLNRELDEFSYAVSHDLKEPLRGIEGVARVLEEECAERLDEAGREYVTSLRTSAARMRRLVDDLLRLSRATRRQYPMERVPMGEIVDDALKSLGYAVEQSHARVSVPAGMPAIMCDRVRMTEVLQNLIGNALKYAAPGRPPEVEIRCDRVTEGWLLSVRDNGVGIAPDEQEKVFDLFHRGASTSAREGTGVGLAICKRVVENHGGRIWAKSTPGDGTTFHVLLPVAPDAEEGPGNHEQRNAGHSAG